MGAGDQTLKLSFIGFPKPLAGRCMEQLGLKQVPNSDASTTGSGFTHHAIMPAPIYLYFMSEVFFLRFIDKRIDFIDMIPRIQ